MAERTVLVTRPAGQAQALCDALRELGWQPVHQPMLVIESHPQPRAEQRRQVMDLDQYQHVIFISGNAVICGMNWIEQFWPQLPHGLNWYAVGSSSAQQLRSYGVAAQWPRQMESEGLLALPSLRSPRGERVLLVTGEGGRNRLQQGLQERGARVDLLRVYRRLPPALTPLQLQQLFEQQNFAALLISSGEGLTNMTALLGRRAVELVADSLLVLPSQRVAELAAECGFPHLAVSDNATDQAMLRCLRESNLSK